MAVQKILSQQIANTGGTPGQVLVANSTGVTWGDANNATNLGGVAAASYQTTAGLSANVATLTANNTSFVGTVSAANIVSNSQLSSNLANYALLSGAAFTGNVSISGNLIVTGTTVTVNAATLDVKDINITVAKGAATAALANGAGLTVDTANIGWYYDNASNTWQSNVGHTPSANVTYNLGSSGLYWSNVYSNNVYLSGTINAASHSIGTSWVANATGVYMTQPLTANGGAGTSGQVLTSNGVTGSPYWSTVTSGGGFTNGQSISVSNFAITGVASANGSNGTAGYYLTSSGASNTYWSAPQSFTSARQQFTGDGTTTSFTVTGGYTANAISVFLNGVLLRNGTEITVTSGTAVVFASAPPSGALIDAIGTLTQSSSGGGGLSLASVQTTSFTATAGYIYPVNTTGGAITVTLPASPSAGQQISIADYSGSFNANYCTLNPNGSKINGIASSTILNNSRESVSIVYVDATQGWITYTVSVTNINAPYTVSYLVGAGGGGGGGANAGGGGGGGALTGTSSLSPGSVYSITVGAGGAGGTSSGAGGTNGANGQSSVFNSITAIGGGGGGGYNSGTAIAGAGYAGGSGGGGSSPLAAGGAGTSGQGYAGGTATSSTSPYCGAGGGGATAVGASANPGAGGAGLASSITGSSVTYAGGGGGGGNSGSGAGGAGGGGAGANGNGTPGAGTVNTGGGGGGGGITYNTVGGGAGGAGVVILSIPTANYSGVKTGSPTVTTFGSNTILTFTASGSYTA